VRIHHIDTGLLPITWDLKLAVLNYIANLVKSPQQVYSKSKGLLTNPQLISNKSTTGLQQIEYVQEFGRP
jgi:hypothetical protein